MECSKDIDVYIDTRLRKWGAWNERLITGGLGYPSSSAFTRIGESGSRQKTSIVGVTFADEEAQITDNAILELEKYKPAFAKIIKINYTCRKSLKEKAKAMGISYDGFKKQLALARAWVAGLILR